MTVAMMMLLLLLLLLLLLSAGVACSLLTAPDHLLSLRSAASYLHRDKSCLPSAVSLWQPAGVARPGSSRPSRSLRLSASPARPAARPGALPLPVSHARGGARQKTGHSRSAAIQEGPKLGQD